MSFKWFYIFNIKFFPVLGLIMKKFLLLTNLLLISSPIFASDEGYYASVKIANSDQKAKSMNTSLRPGIGQFVAGDDKESKITPSIAAGYNFKNNWRTEAEYSFSKKYEYTSGSTNFPTSLNHHKVKTQSLFLNAYRDFDVYQNISVYGSVGLGVAKIESKGWQGIESRQYGSNTDTNLAYSLGAGVSYKPIQEVNIDLGYRYIDLGKTESGLNNFTNVRGLQDEQMKASLEKSEFYLGFRYNF